MQAKMEQKEAIAEQIEAATKLTTTMNEQKSKFAKACDADSIKETKKILNGPQGKELAKEILNKIMCFIHKTENANFNSPEC